MPKVVREKKIVNIDPIQLSEACKAALKNQRVGKLLTTTDEKGIPHCVCKGSMTLMEEGEYKGCLIYMELIEASQSYKNMIWNRSLERTVAVTTYDPANPGSSFQIKGVPYLYIMEGPIWNEILRRTWEVLPTAEPVGAWLIIPTEERDENYMSRRAAEDSRFDPPQSQWLHYHDASYVRRYGLNKK